jgi:ketosteroid isomerase-like protein
MTRELLSAWDEWRYEVDEYRELDDERVLALVRYRARGKSSGLDVTPTRARGAHIAHVHDGKVTRAVFYFDRDRALADLGLAE